MFFLLKKNDRLTSGMHPNQAAQIERQHLNDDEEAANSYKAAFLGYRKSSLDDAARVLKLELEHWRRQKREHKIRQISKDLAELYDTAMKAEQDPGRQKQLRQEAIEAYESAGKEFDYTNQANSARPLFLKAAELAALNEDYQRAIQHFEGAARQCVDNNLLRFSVKDYLLKAGLCHLASRDSVSTKRAIEGYCELDRGFAEQREHQLLADLLQAVESADKTMFSDKLYEYDRISRLDNWKTSICLKYVR